MTQPNGKPEIIEPYWLLFPAGTLLAILGGGVWIAFAFDWLPYYPAVAHARVMVQGFAAAFILGFAGTALPHRLKIPPCPGAVA